MRAVCRENGATHGLSEPLIGLFTLIVAGSMLAEKPRAMEMVRAFLQDRPALLVLGVLGTAAGLAIVLGHQRWTGGVLPLVVTVIGWVILIRGTVYCFCRRLRPPALPNGFILRSSSISMSDLPLCLACIW